MVIVFDDSDVAYMDFQCDAGFQQTFIKESFVFVVWIWEGTLPKLLREFETFFFFFFWLLSSGFSEMDMHLLILNCSSVYKGCKHWEEYVYLLFRKINTIANVLEFERIADFYCYVPHLRESHSDSIFLLIWTISKIQWGHFRNFPILCNSIADIWYLPNKRALFNS